MNDNPLAGHPLFQRDVEAKPVIAEAMADAMAKPLVSVDFGAVEARALAAHEAGMLDDHDGPFGTNRGRDGFHDSFGPAPGSGLDPTMKLSPENLRAATQASRDHVAVVARTPGKSTTDILATVPPDRTALKALAVGMPNPSAESLAVAQAEIEKVSSPDTYIVPASVTDKEIEEITARIAEKTNRRFNVIRGEPAQIAKQQATFVAQAAARDAWDHQTRVQERFASQLAEALRIIESAKRPVKLGFIEHELGSSPFRALGPELDRHPNVQRKTHKNQIYYTWKA